MNCIICVLILTPLEHFSHQGQLAVSLQIPDGQKVNSMA